MEEPAPEPTCRGRRDGVRTREKGQRAGRNIAFTVSEDQDRTRIDRNGCPQQQRQSLSPDLQEDLLRTSMAQVWLPGGQVTPAADLAAAPTGSLCQRRTLDKQPVPIQPFRPAAL